MNSTDNLLIPVTTVDGPRFKVLMAGALAALEQNYLRVDQLNVFPVPDGDTGTNMLLTVRNAYKEIAANDWPDIGTMAVRFAHGALRGSRGNSGTILSELLRGFAHEMSGCHAADGALIARGLREAVRLAYGVVQKPVEGTILTVARETAEEVESAAAETDDLREVLRRAVTRARQSVAHTPELLPILKKAGVVDSGGQGLAYLFEGMLRAAQGETVTLDSADMPAPTQSESALNAAAQRGERAGLESADPLGYGYDVQYILKGENLNIDAVRAAIAAMGDSMVVVGDASLIKVHIHVHDPGVPLSYGVSLGVIDDVVVENMQEQSEAYIAARPDVTAPQSAKTEPPETDVILTPGDIAIVAIVPGDGLRRVFRGLGVVTVISGGQSMNPSSGEILDAIAALDTDKVILLPNNKNIILTAEQSAKLAAEKQVRVVPTRSVPQGIAAMLSFNAEGDLDSVVESMSSARLNVVTGEVTRATRSIQMDSLDVREGQIIGLVDGVLMVSGDTLPATLKNLLWRMNVTDRELITLYYGQDVTAEQAETLTETLREFYPAQEFEVFEGGQPHYDYILSAE